MRFCVLFLMLVLVSVEIHAQNGYNYNWVFGHQCWIKYNPSNQQWQYQSGANLRSEEACTSVSDSAGNLLFYSEGSHCYNALHQVMPNGDSLGVNYVNYNQTGNTFTNGVAVIPMPGQANHYYLFCKNSYLATSDSNISYSIIDMILDGGLGDVTIKDQRLPTNGFVGERIIAVKHANGRDWWVMSDQSDDSIIVQYLVTPQGIQGPNEHHIIYGIASQGSIASRQMSSTLDGAKIVAVASGTTNDLWLCDFDRCTGLLSNENFISVDPEFTAYGVCFSPDNSKLYLSFLKQNILQICIDPATNTLLNYDTLWVNPTNPFNVIGQYPGQMILGPDSAVYTTIAYHIDYFDSVSSFGSIKNVCRIPYPDSCGLACGFEPQAIYVGPDSSYARGGLPNIPNFDLGPLIGSGCDTLHTSLPSLFQNEIIIYPNPATDVLHYQSTEPSSRITAYDVLGRAYKLESTSTKSALNLSNVSLDIQTLPSGIYTIEFITRNNIYAQRFVKSEE